MDRRTGFFLPLGGSEWIVIARVLDLIGRRENTGVVDRRHSAGR
jgi:hypothetical protein